VAQVGVSGGRESRYYTAQNRGVDHILRCKSCQRIVLVTELRSLGCCVCSHKRFGEITVLNEVERAAVAAMDFPSKEAFLAEFEARG